VSRQPSLSRGAWVAVIAAAGLVGAGLQWGPAMVSHWRADRTAARFVTALHDADSASLAALTPNGRVRSILCARRTWPAAYWSRGGGRPSVEPLAEGMDLGYRVIGDTLRERGVPATFLIFIVPERPEAVDRYFANLRGLPWMEPFRACLKGG
jgi:hypothetical protein